jgi:hypothetical protein
MRGHVSAESLARYAEGLVRRGQAAQIRAHLAGCPQCAAEQARLTEVTALLQEIPAPSLPPAVAARLDAALTAESAHRAAQPAAAAQGNGVPQTGAAQPADGDQGRDRRPANRRRWRWLQAPVMVRGLAAAAAVVVLGGVGYGISQAVSSTSSSPSGSTTSSGSAREAKPGSGLAKPGAGTGHPQNAPAGSSSAASTVTRSGTKYQPGTLGQQAAAVLAEPPSTVRGKSPVSAGPLARGGHSEAALQVCAQAVAQGRAVKLVDQAFYQGRPALIIVVQGHPPTVYVTSLGCTLAHRDIRAQAPLAATR